MAIKEAIWEARSQWRYIGDKLGLKKEDIQAIEEPSDGECLHKVLLHWIQSGRATTDHLLEAMSSELINRLDIVTKINSLSRAARLDDIKSQQLERAVREGNLEDVKHFLRDDSSGILTRGINVISVIMLFSIAWVYYADSKVVA